MKFNVDHHEACFVTWHYEVEAESEEEATRRVRKNADGVNLVNFSAEPMPGYPSMIETVGPLGMPPAKPFVKH